jgi:hypothetical protein
VPHEAAPFAARSFVGLGRVCGAPDDRGERVLSLRHFQPLQAKGATRSVDLPALRRPPGHEAVDGAEIAVDGVAVPSGLAVFPDAPDPAKVFYP